MKKHVVPIVVYGLALVVAFIAAEIEWLNVRAGDPLSRPEYRDNEPSAGYVRWRFAAFPEESWRQMYGPRDADGKPVDRPLTNTEQDQMHSHVARETARYELRTFIDTAGRLQALLLVPALIILSGALGVMRGFRVTAFPTLVAITACGLMMFRDYLACTGM